MPESLIGRSRWVDPMKDRSTRLYERKEIIDPHPEISLTQVQRMILFTLSRLEVDAMGCEELCKVIDNATGTSVATARDYIKICKKLWDKKLITDITKWRHKDGKAVPVSSKFKITPLGMEIVERLGEIDKKLLGD